MSWGGPFSRAWQSTLLRHWVQGGPSVCLGPQVAPLARGGPARGPRLGCRFPLCRSTGAPWGHRRFLSSRPTPPGETFSALTRNDVALAAETAVKEAPASSGSKGILPASDASLSKRGLPGDASEKVPSETRRSKRRLRRLAAVAISAAVAAAVATRGGSEPAARIETPRPRPQQVPEATVVAAAAAAAADKAATAAAAAKGTATVAATKAAATADKAQAAEAAAEASAAAAEEAADAANNVTAASTEEDKTAGEATAVEAAAAAETAAETAVAAADAVTAGSIQEFLETKGQILRRALHAKPTGDEQQQKETTAVEEPAPEASEPESLPDPAIQFLVGDDGTDSPHNLSIEEMLEIEKDFLSKLSRDQMHAHALEQTREIETLRRKYAREVQHKQEIKQLADRQLRQFRQDAKEAFNAQAAAAFSFVESRTLELYEMQDEMAEWLAESEDKMQAVEKDVQQMHRAFGSLVRRADTALCASRLGAALSGVESAISRSLPVGEALRALGKAMIKKKGSLRYRFQAGEDDPVVSAVIETLGPFLPTLDAEPVATPAAAAVHLQAALRRSARAAFVPEGSGVAVHFLSNLLGSLYSLLPGPPSPVVHPSRNNDGNGNRETDTKADMLKQNLAVLTQAKMYLDEAELSSAVRCLDSLKGFARREAESDLRKLKLSLHVQQAIDTVRARLYCMNAQLAH